jgi:hypothetical protein
MLQKNGGAIGAAEGYGEESKREEMAEPTAGLTREKLRRSAAGGIDADQST